MEATSCFYCEECSLTHNHAETLSVVLDEGLGLNYLGEEAFGDQREANTAQHLDQILPSVGQVMLQPTQCSIVNLKPNKENKDYRR